MEKNIFWHQPSIHKEQREAIKKHKACILWFTGLPSSGKSTIAHALEKTLNQTERHTYVLDGDNIRHHLNRDLGFTPKDRKENIRRIGEVARLFVDAGLLTITAFISPYASDRAMVRSLVKEGEFIEIYVKCPLEQCIARDPKGLYKKAMNGSIKSFTGINAPYEEPQNPEITIESNKVSVEQSVDSILTYLKEHRIIS